MSRLQYLPFDIPIKPATKDCILGPAIPGGIPLNFVVMGRLIRESKGQHLDNTIPYARLPTPERENLEEEWGMMVDETIDSLKAVLTCPRCDEIHRSPRAMAMLNDLCRSITKTAVEDLKDDLVEAWKDDFDAVVALYQSETSVGDHPVNGGSSEDEERIL